MTRGGSQVIHKARPAPLRPAVSSIGIEKPKHKVRIVHVFAPEIIKTDVANFRGLVQRLTGKPLKARSPGEEEPEILEKKSSPLLWCNMEEEMWESDIRERIKVEVEGEVDMGAGDANMVADGDFCGYPLVCSDSPGFGEKLFSSGIKLN